MFDQIPTTVWVVLCVALLIWLLSLISRPESKIPTEREALTRYVKANRGRIEGAKISSKRGKISKRNQIWLRALGKKITRVGLETRDLDGIDVMAAIFVINPLSHAGDSSATSMKNYLQRVGVVHKKDEISVSRGRGDYKGTHELKAGNFSSHIPDHVFRDGSLDRPGKKNLPSQLKPLPRKPYRRF